jgi:hypothetical protein
MNRSAVRSSNKWLLDGKRIENNYRLGSDTRVAVDLGANREWLLT